MQGVAPTLIYPVPSGGDHPFLRLIIRSIRDYYPLWQVRVFQPRPSLGRWPISTPALAGLSNHSLPLSFLNLLWPSRTTWTLPPAPCNRTICNPNYISNGVWYRTRTRWQWGTGNYVCVRHDFYWGHLWWIGVVSILKLYYRITAYIQW